MTLTQAIEAEKLARERAPRRRWPLWSAAAVIVIGATAAGWTLLREPTRAVALSCVTDGVTAVLPNDGTSPVDACKRLWQQGKMAAGVTVAPALSACVSPNGAVVVIERKSVGACQDEGMAPWTEERSYLAVGQAVRDVRISLHDRFKETGERCATSDDWTSPLADALRRGGAGEWQIRLDRVEPARRCYDVAEIDPTKRAILVIGVPGDDSIGCDPRTGC